MNMELLFVIPTLIVLTVICLERRARLKAEREKEWETTKKKYKYKDWRY